MRTLKVEEIALDDERRVGAIVKLLDDLNPKPKRAPPKTGKLSSREKASVEPAPPPSMMDAARMFPPWWDGPPPAWKRHFALGTTRWAWIKGKKRALCIEADAGAGVLRRVVITDLRSPEEMKLLEQEFTRRGSRLADLEMLTAEVIAGRPERAYREKFAAHLRDVRAYFVWEGREVVESPRACKLISETGLEPEHVELLRQVFALLPRTDEGSARRQVVNLKDGSTPVPKLRTGKSAQDHLKVSVKAQRAKFKSEVAGEAFNHWVGKYLLPVTDPREWTRAKELHASYVKRAGEHGANMGERELSRQTLLSFNGKWGSLMHALYPTRDRREDGWHYPVRVKKVP